jgi:hypothetical protein
MTEMGRIGPFCRSICLVGVMLGAGCQTETQRHDFLARSQQDCALGDPSACAMLESLNPQIPMATSTAPVRPHRTQIEQNTDAIMAGIHRARSSPRGKGVEIAPIAPPYGPFTP